MDELEKLFAEASASVMKATRKEPEAPPAPAPAAEPPPVAAAPVSAPPPFEAPAPPRPSPAGSGPVQVSSGQQTDQGLSLDGTDLAWAGLQNLCLGRAGTTQVIGFRHGGTVYTLSQDKVNLKGLVRQAQPDSVSNWRRLIVELSEKLGDSADPGVQAIAGGGGMIPKYASLEAFIDHVKGG